MTPEQIAASLANEARLDAKAFRENTVYDSEGDPIRLIANANRLDQYADRIEVLEAENARLREALSELLPGKLCGESWGLPDDETVQITVTFGAIKRTRAALKDTRHDTDA